MNACFKLITPLHIGHNFRKYWAHACKYALTIPLVYISLTHFFSF